VSATASIASPVFDEIREHPGFNCSRARLGRQAGSEKLSMSLWDLPAGEAAYPFHFHLAEEEIVVLLEGAPSLRTPAGWREMEEGEVVCFRVGEEGAHQIVNRTEESVRFLAISNQQPDIMVRPDSGSVSVVERRPEGGGLSLNFSIADSAGYFDFEGEDAQ
jgi:uncharacterized cupin superfamily protein